MGTSGKRFAATLLLLVGALLVFPGLSEAEMRTISWNAVTTYTDNTPIEPTNTVMYDLFWTAE